MEDTKQHSPKNEDTVTVLVELFKTTVDTAYRIAYVRDMREYIFIPLSYFLVYSSLKMDVIFRIPLLLLAILTILYTLFTYIRLTSLFLTLMEIAHKIEYKITEISGIPESMLMRNMHNRKEHSFEGYPFIFRAVYSAGVHLKFRYMTPIFYFVSLIIFVVLLIESILQVW